MVGTALAHKLGRRQHDVVRIVRRLPRPGEIEWDPARGTIDAKGLAGVEAVVHLAGAGIGDHRWTPEYKRQLLESRTLSTTLLATTLASLDSPPAVLLSGSAIGFYGPHGDEELDETSAAGTDFLADLCVQWEQAAAPAVNAGIRTVLLRTGIVLSPMGGALKKQLPLFKFGLGGKFGSGNNWQSWISLNDEVNAIEHLLNSTLAGPVNLTSPNPVTNEEFTKVLAKVLRRPAFLPIPKFGPKLLLGAELAEALLFTGQRVMPTKLIGDGYEFAHPSLESALRDLLHKPAS
jgi:uncharacterized protein